MSYLSSDILLSGLRSRGPDEASFYDALKSAWRLHIPRCIALTIDPAGHAESPSAALMAVLPPDRPNLWIEFDADDGRGGSFREGYLMRNHGDDVSVYYALRHRNALHLQAGRGAVIADGQTGRTFWEHGACLSDNQQVALDEIGNNASRLIGFVSGGVVTQTARSRYGCEDVVGTGAQ